MIVDKRTNYAAGEQKKASLLSTSNNPSFDKVMTKFSNIINKARRRMAAARALYVTGRALVIAIVIALAVLTVDRLMNLDLPTLTYLAIVITGAVIGVIAALLHKIDTLSVAVRLDRKLDLRDRLGTAQVIRAGDINNDEFSELITRDAERVAQRIDVKAATPIKFSSDWSLAGVLAIALGAAIAFVPALDRSSRGQTPEKIAEQKEQLFQQQQEIAETIEDAVADVDDQMLDEEVREDLAALKKLAQQLSDDAGTTEDLADARNQSAAELGAIAERLEEQSQRNSQTIDSIAERFAGMEQTDDETPGISEEFEKALRKGEFDEAAEKLDELMEDSQQMSQAERDAVADHFRNMSEQLSEEDESTVADEELDPLREAMRDLGMDDQTVDELLDEEKSADEIASALKEQGVDEDVARELAEDVKESQAQEEIDKQVDEQTKDLADALNEAADDIEQQESQQNNSQEDSSGSNSDSEADSSTDQQEPAETNNDFSRDDSTAIESQEKQDDQTQEESENRAVDNDEASQKETADEEEGEKQTESEQKQQVEDEQNQEENQREEERSAEPGKEQDKQQKPEQQIIDPADPNTPAQEEISQEENSQKEDNRSPAKEIEIPDPKNQQPPDDQSTKKPSNSKEDQSAKKNLPKNLGEALRELAKKKRDAARGKKSSERLREAARKIADSLSDEEKRELAQKWMGEFNKPANDSVPLPNASKDSQKTTGSSADRIVQNTKDEQEPDIEDIDITGDKPATKSIFDWLSDQPITGDPQTTTQSKQVVRKARSAAEHAVGDSTVPKRYHDLIQRYFGKLSDTVEKAAKQTSKNDTTTKETPTKTTTEDDS